MLAGLQAVVRGWTMDLSFTIQRHLEPILAILLWVGAWALALSHSYVIYLRIERGAGYTVSNAAAVYWIPHSFGCGASIVPYPP